MKKNITLISLMLGVMLIGGINAVSWGVEFTSPLEYANVSNELIVEWTSNYNVEGLYLQYKQDDNCEISGTWIYLDGPIISTQKDFEWDTNEIEDGLYCLRIGEGGDVYDTSGPFTIDNTDPEADFDVSGILISYETVEFDASESTDNVIEGIEGSGIASYDWDFDDRTDDGTKELDKHTYCEDGTYHVTLTVTDNAGNIGTYSEDVIIEEIPLENKGEPYIYETGILDITGVLLNEEFDTGLTGVTCTVLPISDGIEKIAVSNDGSDCTIDGTNDIPYTERGVHEIIIKATYGTEIKYYSVEITVYTWWIPLAEEWNLISIPMMPEDTRIKSVFGEIQENIVDNGDYTLFQYDGVKEKWFKAKPTSSWTGDLDYIIPGYGYWIKMENPDILKGFGDITPKINGPLLGVEIANGWNLIGHYGLKDLKINQTLSSLIIGETKYYNTVVTKTTDLIKRYEGFWMTAKFLPYEGTSYTPSQDAIDSVLL